MKYKNEKLDKKLHKIKMPKLTNQSNFDIWVWRLPKQSLLDIGLPEIDSIELARRLHSRRETVGIVLVAIRENHQTEDQQKALAAGFDQYLVKPIDISKLSAVLAVIPSSRV